MAIIHRVYFPVITNLTHRYAASSCNEPALLDRSPEYACSQTPVAPRPTKPPSHCTANVVAGIVHTVSPPPQNP